MNEESKEENKRGRGRKAIKEKREYLKKAENMKCRGQHGDS
jgi:hypothetical protein